MADWFIATEGVKVVKDSASMWPQLITAVSSIGAALGGRQPDTSFHTQT